MLHLTAPTSACSFLPPVSACCPTAEGRTTLFTVASPVSLAIATPVGSGRLPSSVNLLENALLSHSCWLLFYLSFYGLSVLLSYLFPCSHNTKTTSWLDPRLRDKASRALEECEDDGMLLYTNCQNNSQFSCSSDMSAVIKLYW